ncbi:MAG: SpoIIE family protein phosphatase [Anaerolineae bacterium]
MTTLSWPSFSFVVLIASLTLTSYILWRRFQSRRRLVRRVTELEALAKAGRAIVEAELDVAALCELIASEAGTVIDNNTFQVGLFADTRYHIMFWRVNGQIQPTPRTFDLEKGSGLVTWVRDTKEPLLVRDFLKESRLLPAKPHYISDSPPRSAIFIPMVSGERTIGVIAAQSQVPHRFTEEDLRRLMILANQAAAAISHGQLYEQVRRRAAHLELVGQIAHQVNALRDLDEIFNQVVQLIRDRFGFEPVNIFTLDKQTGDAVLVASTQVELASRKVRLPSGQGVVGTAVATRSTVVSNQTAEDSRFQSQFGTFANEPYVDTQAEIVIPLVVNRDVLGVLDVQSPQPVVFTQAEEIALQTLANEVALAIDKARQLALQREQSWVATAQLQMAQALSKRAEMDDIVAAVTRLTPMLVGVSFCGILLWDDGAHIYRGHSLYGAEGEAARVFARLRLAIGDWSALDAVHVGQETLTTEHLPPWLQWPTKGGRTVRKVTLLPMSTQTQTLGVMLVSEFNPADQGDYSGTAKRREELLQNIVGQAAQAIETAYLRIAQQEEAWVNTALLQVAEAVNNLTDLNEILDTIVRLVPMLVGVKSALVLIWDEERQTFYAGPSHGLSKMGHGLLETGGIERGEFLTSRPLSAELLTPTATYYALQLPPWLETVLGTPTAYAFPLNARGRLVGTMLVGTEPDKERTFSTRRLNILNGIAHQAATAVVNNQLYQESAERSLLEKELNVAREIQASLIPPGNPDIPGCDVASYWEAARQVSGDFYDFLKLHNGKWGIVIADVADKGIPAALFMALSRTILRTVAFNRHDPAEALMRANEIMDHDTQSDLFVTVFYAIWDAETGQLSYANGGHNPPLLLRRNGTSRLLTGDGMALGVLPDITVECRQVRIHPGDTLLLYTDGVTEAMNEDDDEFGLERLRLAAEAARTQDAAHIVRAITEAIRDHAGDTPQFDDITLVVMKHNRR